MTSPLFHLVVSVHPRGREHLEEIQLMGPRKKFHIEDEGTFNSENFVELHGLCERQRSLCYWKNLIRTI